MKKLFFFFFFLSGELNDQGHITFGVCLYTTSRLAITFETMKENTSYLVFMLYNGTLSRQKGQMTL